MMKYITTSQQDMLKSIGQYRRGLILSHIRLSKYYHLKYSVQSLIKLSRIKLIKLNKDMREGKTLLVEFLPKTEQNKLENISNQNKIHISAPDTFHDKTDPVKLPVPKLPTLDR